MLLKGETIIKNISYGSDKSISAVYKGDNLIYPDGAAYGAICCRQGTASVPTSPYANFVFNNFVPSLPTHFMPYDNQYPRSTDYVVCSGSNSRYGWTKVLPRDIGGNNGMIINTSGASRNCALFFSLRWTSYATTNKTVYIGFLYTDATNYFTSWWGDWHTVTITPGTQEITGVTRYMTVAENYKVFPLDIVNLSDTDAISHITYQLIVSGY